MHNTLNFLILANLAITFSLVSSILLIRDHVCIFYISELFGKRF